MTVWMLLVRYIIGRAKRTPHWGVQSRFRVLYILFTPHVQRERGKVIGRGVHIYICVCGRKKYLNRTLEIDSPFQKFAVGLLVEFID